ncbi:MAG: hypothetical protein ACJAS3_003330, partial [Roseivirga sp.]
MEYKGEPLNEILLDLNDRFGIQISVNASLANQCLITIKNEFSNIAQAIEALAKECQLTYVKIGEVYTFRNQQELPPDDKKS